jgi:hypothetical protein
MMRYWGFLIAKLAGVSLAIGAGWMMIHMGAPATAGQKYPMQPFGTDLGYTMSLMMLWLMGVGLFYLSIWDQRYRCRTCGRRLHMPVSFGGWNSLLLRSPRTDYICRFGHGTLRVPDVDLTGTPQSDWQPIDDMWKELKELETADK